MANFGSFLASAVSARNENTAALVNINLDITLFRCQPPAEFLSVGSALAPWRKKEAEDGTLHRTTCCLGFLFSDILPDTPELIKAYGTRASEILRTPNINPRGTAKDGPFQDFVGVDGTCIWAAATSTPASISTYLLACILAGAWDAKTSTSIWVELIRSRKAQVQSMLDRGKVVNPHTAIASQQEICRDDIAKWDASVRAWLRRADRSMVRKRDQFALIMNNVKTPFVDTGTTYEKVTKAWIRSMETLERLLNNEPQQALDRTILFAISSWHLYPDLLVFLEKATKVAFEDNLFPKSAALSLGLEYRTDQRGEFHRWSLALSHLRYYGDPVKVQSREGPQRVSMQQMWLVALGSIFRDWQVPYASLNASITMLAKLGVLINSASKRDAAEISWLRAMCEGISSFQTATEADQQTVNRLVQFGFRRATKFLGGSGASRLPFFGLSGLGIFGGPQNHRAIEQGFKYLRAVAVSLKLRPDQVVFRYTEKIGDGNYHEWATMPLSTSVSTTVNNESNARGVRWIGYTTRQEGYSRHDRVNQRELEISKVGERCEVAIDDAYIPTTYNHAGLTNPAGRYTWQRPPPLFSSSRGLMEFKDLRKFMPILHMDFAICAPVSEAHSISWNIKETDLYLHAGHMALDSNPSPDNVVREIVSSLKQRDALSTFDRQYDNQVDTPIPKIHAQRIPGTHRNPTASFLGHFANVAPPDFRDYVKSMYRAPLNWILSLRALELASALYRSMPTATVSLRVVEQELHKAEWLPDSLAKCNNQDDGVELALTTSIEQHCQDMSRENSLGCIAMFDSGAFNIPAGYMKDVIAICFEDSIFVAGILLSDPKDHLPGDLGMSVRHLVGNVGQSGMVLMIAPVEPRIRPQKCDARLVQHQTYDGRSRDSFQGTSLHLSFTEWKMPLGCVSDSENTGGIGYEVVQVEAVIAVQDNGKWVADIDVLELEREGILSIDFPCSCDRTEHPAVEVFSLDSWEELLDPPLSPAVMRANDNWVARLAAASILTQQGHNHCIAVLGNESICWSCLNEAYIDPEPHFPSFIIH